MTEQLMHTEVNCETGEVTIRPLTDEEIADIEASAIYQAEMMEAEASAREARDAARVLAASKLEALGLSIAEIEALTGQTLPTSAS